MRYLIFTLVILLTSAVLAGQKTINEKPKRWHFSSHLGLDVYNVNTTSNGAKGSKLLLAELGYRIHRNVDLGIQLGHQREIWTGYTSYIINVFLPDSPWASWNSRRLSYFIGLQGKLNFRIGQGDLSLSGAFGVNRHTNLTRARSPYPFYVRMKMEPLTDYYTNVQLGYTYWATPRLGLMAGYSVLKLFSGRILPSADYSAGTGTVPFYSISSWESEGVEFDENTLSSLRGLVDISSRHYFTLGLTARIF